MAWTVGPVVRPIASVESAYQDDSLACRIGLDLAFCRYGEGLGGDAGVATALLAARGEIGAGESTRTGRTSARRSRRSSCTRSATRWACATISAARPAPARPSWPTAGGPAPTASASRSWTTCPRRWPSTPRARATTTRRRSASYDRWAIMYGYAAVGGAVVEPAMRGVAERSPRAWTPEVELNGLRTIASEAADPEHLYGSDEDAGFGASGLDPTISRYDQTSDPLAWARDRVTLVDGLFDSLETRVVAPGQSYARLRSIFTDLLADRWYALLVTTKYLGGATISRDHRGDPGERPALVNVPAARSATRWPSSPTRDSARRPTGSDPDLLSRLGPDRWSHWGSSPYGARADFPVHDWALNQQGGLLSQLLDPAVLARIRDAELRMPRTASPNGTARALLHAERVHLVRDPRRRPPGRLAAAKHLLDADATCSGCISIR